ncbi:MAG TPA: DUF418 domain-containing protein [Burkholderiaceae bacterium]|nr:DUF418 domain-containing protein [Burkholderiaceae bacterium]
MAHPIRERLALVDALRAFALIGILQVNVQSFLWGVGDPLGYFHAQPSGADVWTFFWLDVLAVNKFMPLFALLFGFGMALQWRSVKRSATELPEQVLRRRYRFLLLLGVAHGVVLYFGDILTLYALCALWVMRWCARRPVRLLRAVWVWLAIYIGITLLLAYLSGVLYRALTGEVDAQQVPQEAFEVFAIYALAPFGEQLIARVQDYFQVLTASVLLASPLVIALFALGALAARQGWVHHPQRHAGLWRGAVWLGLGGLILSIVGAAMNTQAMRDFPGNPNPTGGLLLALSFPATLLSIALVVRWRERPTMRRLIEALAPVGRMPLTNYVMQSLLMGALLSGWGLGLGAGLGHAALALWALAIVLVQFWVSRAWMARFAQGPLEALWRWVTYRGRWARRS